MSSAGIRSDRTTEPPSPFAAARTRHAAARTGRAAGGRRKAARITQARPSSFVTGFRR